MESNDKLEQLLKQMYSQESLHEEDIDTSDIIDEEWVKFEAEHFKSERLSIRKIAAMFIGLLMLSGIAYAAVHIISNKMQQPQQEQTLAATNAQHTTLNAQVVANDSTLTQPVVFEDVELATILANMATFYQLDPVYKHEATKHIRLYFTWDKQQDIDELIATFNKFERIHMTRNEKKLIVE